MRRWMPVAAVAAALALAGGAVTAAVLAAPRPPVDAGVSTAHPVGPWLVWARGIGFSAASGDEVSAAIDTLTDAQLAELDEVLADRDQGFSTGLVMRLGSRLFAGATAEQVERLHVAVPSLEPGVRAGETWRRFEVGTESFSIDDVHQGSADDCWLLAGLGAVAVMDPAALAAGIRANDNGTFTIPWTVEGAAVPVTISPYLPVNGDSLVYAHAEWSELPNWSSLFEKSHAALPTFGSYAALAGGSMVDNSPVTVAAALTSLTGVASTTQPARSVTLAQLRAAVGAGLPTTATTFLTGIAPKGDTEVGMVDRHVYVVESVEGAVIVLRNPWGYTTTVGPETVRLGIEEFNRRVLLVTFGGGD